MDKPQFVYVTYMATAPEQLWNALMDGEMTKQYWGRHQNVSDWKVGSTWTHQDYDDAGIVDIVGKVVESTPPRRTRRSAHGSHSRSSRSSGRKSSSRSCSRLQGQRSGNVANGSPVCFCALRRARG
jgi:hypothetical protein